MKATPMRREYGLERLDEATIAADPIDQFRAWFEAAEAAGLPEPNAMTLATATPDGRPSARVVLLKAFGASGFAFFTNFESRKGAELAANPHAALVFFWAAHERQVRIEGRVERVTEAESDAYFAGRPPGAQRGAWVSEQSRPVADRAALEARLREVEGRFGDGPVPRPPHWGGFRVVPEAVEFWQGRPNRLHDRLLYRRGADGGWTVERLAP